MIKCNVTVCGTVCRQAQMRANKEGKQFISFGISVVVQAKTGINKTVEISVAKDGDNYAYTWIRFMQFDTTKADWVQAKAGINAKGDLQVGAYNDRLDLTCRVTELTPWEKKAASTNQ